MIELTRLQTGNFKIEDSIKLYDFLKLDFDKMLDKIISLDKYFEDKKKVNLDKDTYIKFINGVKFDVNNGEGIVRVYAENRYRGLGIIEDKVLKRYVIE